MNDKRTHRYGDSYKDNLWTVQCCYCSYKLVCWERKEMVVAAAYRKHAKKSNGTSEGRCRARAPNGRGLDWKKYGLGQTARLELKVALERMFFFILLLDGK